jgi:lipopolysaccharide exporter
MRAAIFRGASWVFLVRMFDRALGLISVLILARLLMPADYGLVAMAVGVIAVLELFTALGSDFALVQKPNASATDYSSAWTLNLTLSGVCAVFTLALAYPTAQFFAEPRLVSIMAVLALSQVIAGAENTGMVEYRRELNFAVEFRFVAIKRLAAFAVTVLLAWTFQSYWALLAGTVTSRLCGLLLSFQMHPFRPTWSFASARDLIRFSKWTLLNNVAIAGLQRLPHFYAGRAFGSETVGVYVMSYEIGTMAATELAAPVNRAAMPGYSRIANDAKLLRSTFLDIGSLVLLVAIPTGVGVAALAHPLVLALLGPAWQHAVPFVQVLSIAGVLTAATANNGIALMATGAPSNSAWTAVVRLGILCVAMMAFVPWMGAMGLAWAELLATTAGFGISCLLAFKRLNVSVLEYLQRNWRAMVAAVIMASVARRLIEQGGLGAVNLTTETAWWKLISTGCLAAITFCAVTMALWWTSGRPQGPESIVLQKLKDKWPST